MLIPSRDIGNSTPHTSESPVAWAHSGFPVSQIPEKSGLPSDRRGAGADMSTFPSAVLGAPAVGYFSHWASTGTDVQVIAPAITSAPDAFNSRDMRLHPTERKVESTPFYPRLLKR